jgi:hypothetical protein
MEAHNDITIPSDVALTINKEIKKHYFNLLETELKAEITDDFEPMVDVLEDFLKNIRSLDHMIPDRVKTMMILRHNFKMFLKYLDTLKGQDIPNMTNGLESTDVDFDEIHEMLV